MTQPDASVSATASTAYRAALEVIASVEPRIADATRAELEDQRAPRVRVEEFSDLHLDML